VWALVGIKTAVENTASFAPETIPANIPTNDDGMLPLSFTDYVTALRAKRVCVRSDIPPGFFDNFTIPPAFQNLISLPLEYYISGMDLNGLDWQVPLVKCDSRRCNDSPTKNATTVQSASDFCEYMIIGVSGSSVDDVGGNERAKQFKDWVEATWPAIVFKQSQGTVGGMPFDHELIRQFQSSKEIDEYVTDNNYGKPDRPRMAMGIVFDGNSLTDFKYRLRQNSTNYNTVENDGGQPVSRTTPLTNRHLNSYARTDDSVCTLDNGAPTIGSKQNSCTAQYIYNGVITFQRLVHDFILVQTNTTDAGYRVAEAGVQFVPFPSREYVTNGFYTNVACKSR
jgi:hypothetical protein